VKEPLYSWPYPRTREQLLQVVMVVLAALFIGLIGTAAQAKHYRDKPLNGDNLQQAAASLAGFASEAAILSDQSAHGRSPVTYQAAYFTQLGDQTRQVTQFLEAHTAAGALTAPAERITADGHRLDKHLADTAGHTDPAKLQAQQRAFENLQSDLQRTGDSL
jgi:hypothetical protein